MKLNLMSDPGGRSFARAMQRAYQMGYDDGRAMKKKGIQVRAKIKCFELAKSITSASTKKHAQYLRGSYGAGLWQYRREIGE